MSKGKKRKIINYHLLAIVIASFFMAIGYASVNNVTLDLSGSVSVEAFKGLFIYDTNISSGSDADIANSYIELFYETMLKSKVVLNNNVNSYLDMDVTIYNKSDNDVYFDDVVYSSQFYDNNNIDFVLTGLTHNQMLSKNNNITFSIRFKYTDDYKASNPSSFTNILNSYLNFNFKKGYSITYSGINGTSSYPSLVLDGDNLSVTFTGDVPSDIKVTGSSTNTVYTSGTDYTYSNGVLTFNAVSEDLVIEKVSSGIIYDNTTTAYDHNTLTPGTTTVFNNIAGKPKVVVDSNGKVLSFEYTDVGTGVVFSNNYLDTGVDAFDSDGYTIHMVFKTDTSSNTGRYILNALKKTNGNNAGGFTFFISTATQLYFNASSSSKIKNQVFGTRMGDGWKTTSGEKTYTFDLTYTPSPNKSLTAVLTPTSDGNNQYVANSTHLQYYPDTLADTSITIGGTGVTNGKNMSSMTVLEFSVSKN